MIYSCKAQIKNKIVTLPVVASDHDQARDKFIKAVQLHQKNNFAPAGDIINIVINK